MVRQDPARDGDEGAREVGCHGPNGYKTFHCNRRARRCSLRGPPQHRGACGQRSRTMRGAVRVTELEVVLVAAGPAKDAESPSLRRVLKINLRASCSVLVPVLRVLDICAIATFELPWYYAGDGHSLLQTLVALGEPKSEPSAQW